MEMHRAASSPVDFQKLSDFHADDGSSPADDTISRAVTACARVRRNTAALAVVGERYLRAVREAGYLLSLVQHSDGGRPVKNSSRGLTSYQYALQQAGISRQTANVWRRVAEIGDDAFAQFVNDATREGWDLTIAELLRICAPPSAREDRPNTVTLHLSEAEVRAFDQHISVLGGVHFCRTTSETVMAVLRTAYAAWLTAQCERERSRSTFPVDSPR